MEIKSDDLVNSDQVATDVLGDSLVLSDNCLVSGSFEVSLSLKNVEDVLLTLTKALKSKCLTDVIFVFNAHIKASVEKIRGGFIIAKRVKLLSNASVKLQRLLDLLLLLAANSDSVALLSHLESVAEIQQALLRLDESALLYSVELVFLLELLAGHDAARSGLSGDVEEVHIGLKVALLHELDGLRLGCNLLLKFEIVVLLLEI